MPTVFTQAQIDWYLAQARSAGVPDSFIDSFLIANPLDYHRILEGYASEKSAQESAQFQSVARATALPSQFLGSAYGSPGSNVPQIFMATPMGQSTAMVPARQTASIYAPYQGTIGLQPNPATSGPPGILGYASSSDMTGVRAPGPSGGVFAAVGSNPMMLLLLAAGAYLLWRMNR